METTPQIQRIENGRVTESSWSEIHRRYVTSERPATEAEIKQYGLNWSRNQK